MSISSSAENTPFSVSAVSASSSRNDIGVEETGIIRDFSCAGVGEIALFVLPAVIAPDFRGTEESPSGVIEKAVLRRTEGPAAMRKSCALTVTRPFDPETRRVTARPAASEL